MLLNSKLVYLTFLVCSVSCSRSYNSNKELMFNVNFAPQGSTSGNIIILTAGIQINPIIKSTRSQAKPDHVQTDPTKKSKSESTDEEKGGEETSSSTSSSQKDLSEEQSEESNYESAFDSDSESLKSNETFNTCTKTKKEKEPLVRSTVINFTTNNTSTSPTNETETSNFTNPRHNGSLGLNDLSREDFIFRGLANALNSN